MRIKFSQIGRTQDLVKRHKQLDWIPNFLTIVKTTNRPHRFGRPLANHLKPLHKIIISSWTFFKLLIRFEKFLLNYLKGINFGEYKISRISRSWPKVTKTYTHEITLTSLFAKLNTHKFFCFNRYYILRV